jgi:hypothetical protein
MWRERLARRKPLYFLDGRRLGIAFFPVDRPARQYNTGKTIACPR